EHAVSACIEVQRWIAFPAETRQELRQMVEDVVVRLSLDHAGQGDQRTAVDEDVDLEVEISLRPDDAGHEVDDEHEAQEKDQRLDRVAPDGLHATDVRDQ